jgi:F1F0 ATPase subunit 2
MFPTVHLLLVFTMGMALGAAYFGGLWYTLKRLPDARRPFQGLFCSFLARATVAMTGFGLAMNGGWDHLIAALGGFIVAREIFVRRFGRNAS